MNCHNYHYPNHGAAGKLAIITDRKLTMSRVGRCLPRILWVIGVGLLLFAPALRASIESEAASEACTTSTGLHCEIYGSGDPILFLHGLGGSLYSWRNQIALSAQYKVVLIDFRGAGDSPKPNDKHYSIKEQADLIYQFIHEHNLNNLTIVGNSYGGAVSLLLAIRLGEEDPGRLSKLILIDAGAYPDHLPSHLKILRVPLIGWQAVHLIPPKAQVRKVLRDSYYAPCKITPEQIAAYARPIAARGGRHALLQLGKQAIPRTSATSLPNTRPSGFLHSSCGEKRTACCGEMWQRGCTGPFRIRRSRS